MRQKKTDLRLFAAAPTLEQARRIWWDDLKAIIPRWWCNKDHSDSTLTITTKWGASLTVLGLDKPQRLEGVPWDGCIIDEIADCRAGTWNAHIRPALADRNGWAWLIGVPDREGPGQADYRKLYELARAGDPDWACHHWPSSLILPRKEVAALKRTMDDETFRQEVLGEFVLAAGLAFPMFNVTTHVSERATYDPALPLCWALDFNVNPMCSGLIQHDTRTGEVRVIHEFILADSSTQAACDAVLMHCVKHGWPLENVHLYGDATGHARDSTSGTSDWAIVRRRLASLNPRFKVPSRSPAIKDTLNALRARLRSADGTSSLLIHPSCKRLINDLQDLPWPGDLSEGHSAAWLRYFCEWEYPVRFERCSEPGRLSV